MRLNPIRISNLVFRIFKSSIYALIFLSLVFFPAISFAKDNNELVALSKQIIEAKTNEELYPVFEELSKVYFRENKYAQFIEYLKSLSQKKRASEPFINYYIALARYSQLKHLQENQIWDEYFNQGNSYRDEITTAAQKTLDATTVKNALNIYARLLLWQFHKDQEDVFAEEALSDLMNAVLEYSKEASDLNPAREVADRLFSYGEKAKSREFYRIYAEKIVTSNIKDDELNGIALGFYKEGNLELAQNLYDFYVERVSKTLAKEKLIPLLIDIAKLFTYKDEGAYDMLYAEKLFGRIEGLGGKEAFNQELMYLRAFNLEKAKEYLKAKDLYIDLARDYPESSYADEADFKAGLIYTYILRDIKSGREYFAKLANRKQSLSPHCILSLYQLGLLYQWENDFTQAKDNYNKLINEAGDEFRETVALARQRLEEIEQVKPIEYNLKTFLDVSLNEDYSIFDMTKLELKAHPYKAKKGEDITITSTAYAGQSGCMQVELQYLWSGDLGKEKPSANQAAFNTSYTSGGTKVINLVVVSPAGIIDRNIDFIDVD